MLKKFAKNKFVLFSKKICIDNVFFNYIIYKFINNILQSGKKSIAEKHIYFCLRYWQKINTQNVILDLATFKKKNYISKKKHNDINIHDISNLLQLLVCYYKPQFIYIKKYQRKKLSNRQKKRLAKKTLKNDIPNLIINEQLKIIKSIKLVTQFWKYTKCIKKTSILPYNRISFKLRTIFMRMKLFFRLLSKKLFKKKKSEILFEIIIKPNNYLIFIL